MKQQETLFNRNFILLSVASLLMFVGFYLIMPIVAKYMIEIFNADTALAGAVVASYIITSLLTRPFSGYLVDKFDRRKFYLLTYVVFAILMLGYVVANAVWGVVLTRILLGVFFSLVTTAASTIAIDVIPSSRRGEGVGYYGAIIVFAMATGPMAGLYLLEYFNYNMLFVIAAASCFTGVAIASFVKTETRKPVIRERLSWDRFLLRDALSVAVIVSLSYFLYGSLGAYVALYIEESGLDFNSGRFFLLFAIGIIASRAVAGYALKRGLYDLLIRVGLMILIISGVLFATHLDDVIFPITSVLLGIGFGLTTPSIQTMIVNMVPANRRGTANSTYFIALDLGSGSGMLVGGMIAKHFDYQILFGFGTGLIALALMIYTFYSRKDYRRRLERISNEE